MGRDDLVALRRVGSGGVNWAHKVCVVDRCPVGLVLFTADKWL